jgi:predicted heme/steroid binding protein
MVYGDSLGIQAPTITVSGVINLADYDKTTGLPSYIDDNNKVVDLSLLMQMWKSGHTFSLVSKYDDDPTQDIYRIHTLSGTFPSETIAPIKVRVAGLSYNCSTQHEEGQLINFTLRCVEVRA